MKTFFSFSEIVDKIDTLVVGEQVLVVNTEYTVYNISSGKNGLKVWKSLQLGVLVGKSKIACEAEIEPFGNVGYVSSKHTAEIDDVKQSAHDPNLCMMLFKPKSVSLAF